MRPGDQALTALQPRTQFRRTKAHQTQKDVKQGKVTACACFGYQQPDIAAHLCSAEDPNFVSSVQWTTWSSLLTKVHHFCSLVGPKLKEGKTGPIA
eukprot:4329094-Amphidinium_carterae.1